MFALIPCMGKLYQLLKLYIMNYDLHRQELTKFITSKEWHWFLTLTTSYEMSYNSAYRLSNRYFKNLHKSFNNSIFEMFFTIEPHKIKGGTHIHALLKTDFNNLNFDKHLFTYLVDTFQKTAGRKMTGKFQRNKIVKIKGDTQAVSKYCVKYITKETVNHWDYYKTGITELID